jgi:transposase
MTCAPPTTLEYVNLNEAAKLLCSHRTTVLRKCINKEFDGTIKNNKGQWMIPLTSLSLSPKKELEVLQEKNEVQKLTAAPADDTRSEITKLDEMNGWQKETVMMRKAIVDQFCNTPHSMWPRTMNDVKEKTPGLKKLSTGTIYRWIDAYKQQGILGLVPGYGNRAGTTAVPEEAAQIFDSLVLKDTAPSYYQAYVITKGYMARLYPDKEVPHLSAFMRRYKKKYRQQHQDLARKGYAFYQRHWEYFIARDATDIASGKGWFSDHHQLDTICSMPDGTQVRPWITEWRDIRSGKMLAWHMHPEAPNANHIFYAFYLAAKDFGLPDFIYVDNGKDYRCRDLTGCYKNIKPWDDASEAYGKSLMGILKVEIVFATAYNAQAKSIERDHGKIINQFSRFMLGYTGGNPTARPESTELACVHEKALLKARGTPRQPDEKGNILSYKEVFELFNLYITEVFNKSVSNGKLLNGMCPDEAFGKYRTDIRTISADELKICAMRTSKSKRIDRNGVIDNELGIELRYWAEWMHGIKGDVVYMRRDIKAYQTAWVWREEDDVFLGKAELAEAMKMHAKTNLDVEKVKTEIARKRHDLNLAKQAIKTDMKLDSREIMQGLIDGTRAINDERGWAPTPGEELPVNYEITDLGLAMAEDARMQKTGTYDLAEIAPIHEERKQLYLFDCDKPST